MPNPTQEAFDAAAIALDRPPTAANAMPAAVAALAQVLAEEAPTTGFTVITTGRRPVDITLDGTRVSFTIGGREPIAFDRFQAEAMVNGLMHLLDPDNH